MTFTYFIQHNFFKQMVLKRLNSDALRGIIEEENGDTLTGLIMHTVEFFGSEAPEEKNGTKYETDFFIAGNTKLARCRFVGELPLNPPECSSILIAVTDKVYYFTVECTMDGGYMLCRWDDENHINYGTVEEDAPSAYADLIKQILEG